MKTLLKLLLVCSLFTSCIPMQKVPKNAKMTDFFHFQKAKDYDASKWAVFLPGTGGLRIFKDTTHYYNVAKKLNAEGISVLLVDNVAAYKASKRDVDEEEPAQLLWTLEEALKWAKQNGNIDPNSQGSIVGWSRAGLGLIPLANDSNELKTLNIKSIALFYPANGYEIQLKPKVPVLIMTGGKDKIVKVDDIFKYMIAENATIKVYDNAYHGYDVESLKKGKYYRYIPFISKKNYLLKYDEKAANESFEELIKFLKK
ncbi:dienelactone hydrolase-like enzyme [Aequorivita sublithincola DSM 14238]|uniref:Dienelactone hydrolase-like enzyme n=1 Tax=Aequorivita sublithincola (strain DSM 14238 / LMG 21431 / ACAM 643 / 9-3) TaxID=746697 RepID=I3Z068_AEQSU|nr:dienelactone hydrolase family protein [Aequorivita sublithincola]AFL82636.1 dienelactone hydrolase-like enzyme [Aequorivita sublithincola DSM 14238]